MYAGQGPLLRGVSHGGCGASHPPDEAFGGGDFVFDQCCRWDFAGDESRGFYVNHGTDCKFCPLSLSGGEYRRAWNQVSGYEPYL